MKLLTGHRVVLKDGYGDSQGVVTSESPVVVEFDDGRLRGCVCVYSPDWFKHFPRRLREVQPA